MALSVKGVDVVERARELIYDIRRVSAQATSQAAAAQANPVVTLQSLVDLCSEVRNIYVKVEASIAMPGLQAAWKLVQPMASDDVAADWNATKAKFVDLYAGLESVIGLHAVEGRIETQQIDVNTGAVVQVTVTLDAGQQAGYVFLAAQLDATLGE